MKSYNCSEDKAREIAKRLFANYDTNKTGIIDSQKGLLMMKAALRNCSNSNPTVTDSLNFVKCHDVDQDGLFTLKDMEALAIRFFCNVQAETELPHSQKNNSKVHEFNEPKNITKNLSNNVQNQNDKEILFKKNYNIDTPDSSNKYVGPSNQYSNNIKGKNEASITQAKESISQFDAQKILEQRINTLRSTDSNNQNSSILDMLEKEALKDIENKDADKIMSNKHVLIRKLTREGSLEQVVVQ